MALIPFKINFIKYIRKIKVLSLIILFLTTLVACTSKEKDFGLYELNNGTLMVDDDFYLNYCDIDRFDCSDYTTQRRAQIIYDECKDSYGSDNKIHRDVHKLDVDGDGIACESLAKDNSF